RHAHDLGRPLMAVPGPVTSAQSAGCHEAIREWGAVCVTSARDVMQMLEFAADQPGGQDPARPQEPVLARDLLDPDSTRVLEAVPARGGEGTVRVASTPGGGIRYVERWLGGGAGGGGAEGCGRGWRLRRPQPVSYAGPNA